MRVQGLLICTLCLISSTTVQAITLKDVVRHTLQTNPTILAAKSNVGVQLQQLKGVKGRMLPQVSARVSRGKEYSKNSSVPGSSLTNFNDITLTRQESTLHVNQLIFDAGLVHNQIAEQKYVYASAQSQLRLNQDEVTLQAVEAYFNVLRNRQLLKLASENIRVHKKSLRQVTKLFDQKVGSRVDVSLAKSRLALAETQKLRIERQLQVTNAEYYQITNTYPAQRLTLPKQPKTWLPKTKNSAITRTLHDNPAIHAAKESYVATQKQVNVARGEFMPRFDVEFDASKRNNVDGVRGPNDEVLGAVVMNYDIFRGGSDQANIRRALSEQFESQHQLHEMEREARRNVETAWIEMSNAKQRQKVLAQYVKYQKDVVRDYKTQFTLGKRPLFNVLDAERELFQANVTYTNSLFDAYVGTYRVITFTGKLLNSFQ